MTARTVTDEQYGRLCSRIDDLKRRIKEGSVPYDEAMDGLQQLIEHRRINSIVCEGRPTTLRAGDRMVFYPNVPRLAMGRGGNRIVWAIGDDKKLVPFVNNERNFRLLAGLIAELHGLDVQVSQIPGNANFVTDFVAIFSEYERAQGEQS